MNELRLPVWDRRLNKFFLHTHRQRYDLSDLEIVDIPSDVWNGGNENSLLMDHTFDSESRTFDIY